MELRNPPIPARTAPRLPAGDDPGLPGPRGYRGPAEVAPPGSGARRSAEWNPPPSMDPAVERRAIAGVAITVVALALMLDGPLSWLAAALLGGGVLLATRAAATASASPVVLARPGRSFRAAFDRLHGLEAGVVPGVLAAGLVLASRLVAIDWILVVVLGAAAVLLAWTISVEQRLGGAGAGNDVRWQVVLAALAAGFIGFAGVAAMVAGGLAEPIGAPGTAGNPGVGGGGPGSGAAVGMGEADLLLLAAGDAVIAGLLGFRLVRLGPATRWEATLSAGSYAGVLALGAGLLRAMAIPQLLGPALLTLLLYLWDAFHATTPSIRRDPRWRWQVGLLLVLSAVVIGWNLQLRS